MQHYPEQIQNELNRFFSTENIVRAIEIQKKKVLSLSFKKGSLETGFIASGIITQKPTLNVKVQIKDGELLSHRCQCLDWKKDKPCIHVTALAAEFLMQEAIESGDYYFEGSVSLETLASKQERLGSQLEKKSVRPKHYGSIIRSANRLMGGDNRSSYSSYHYQLDNGTIVPFSSPSGLAKKIHIELKADTQTEHLYYPIFSITNHKGEQEKAISIFEHYYIFDWSSGRSYDLPQVIRDYVNATKEKSTLLSLDDHFSMLLSPDGERNAVAAGVIDITIDEALLDNHTDITPLPLSVGLIKNANQGQSTYQLRISFFENFEPVLCPDFLKLFTAQNGYLSSFKSKNEMQLYLKSLLHETKSIKKHIYTAENKDLILHWSQNITSTHNIIYRSEQKKFYSYNPSYYHTLMVKLVEFFGDIALKNSSLEFNFINIPLSQRLFEMGLPGFYQFLAQEKIPFTYQHKPIKTWSGKVNFTRRKNDINWFEIGIEMSHEDLEFIKNVQLGEKFIVNDDELIILSDEQKKYLKFIKKYINEGEQNLRKAKKIDPLQQNQDSIQHSDVLPTDSSSVKLSLKLNRMRIFEVFELAQMGADNLLTEEETALCERLASLDALPSYPIPQKTQDIARPYQAKGYQWIRFLHEFGFGACLADDMGLGKTLQTIMFLDSLKSEYNKVLIACPVSILLNWQAEIAKFSDLDCHVYYGSDRQLTGNEKIIITSYGIIKRDFEELFSKERFDIFIMDEVHHLKNIKSLGAYTARNINAKFRLCLTGTPVENDILEFYNIMDLSLPGIWGQASLGRKTQSDERIVARTTARPFLLRRTKGQVLTDLPDKEEHKVYLNLSPQENYLYTEKLKQIQSTMATEANKNQFGQVLKNLLELRQLCLWQSQKENFLSTKIEYLLEQLEQILAQEHQVLIFSQFTTYLDFIQNEIKKLDWKYVRIDGTQSMHKRQEQVNLFQSGDVKLFLISLKAGGVGLNLTKANYIFIMDPWWNPAVENQAIDRAHRIGQTNKVTVYRPIIKNTVEEKVLQLQEAKKELFHELLGQSDNASAEKQGGESYSDEISQRLTLDEIKSLLN